MNRADFLRLLGLAPAAALLPAITAQEPAPVPAPGWDSFQAHMDEHARLMREYVALQMHRPVAEFKPATFFLGKDGPWVLTGRGHWKL